MELLQLRYFQKVAEMESITKASNFFMIPQPSMSQTISRLEKELGVKLFDRRNGKLFLNERGQHFLCYVNRALQELDNGIAAATEQTKAISGTVKVKVMENHRFILTCIPQFAELYPDVSISVSHGYYEDPNVTYDLCISSRMSYRNMTACEPLVKEHLVLAVHENNPLASQEVAYISDLRGQKIISLPYQSSLHALTLNHCRAQGFEPLIPIVCDDPYFIRKYVSDDMGIALAPAISWKGRFRENTVLLPLEDPQLYVTSYLLWDDKRYLSPAVRKFRDYLLEEAKKLENNLVCQSDPL